MIETVNEQERDAIKECTKLGELGLQANLPGRISPKVILYDVPNEMKNETILEQMFEKNLKECMTQDEFNKRVKIINRLSNNRPSLRSCPISPSTKRNAYYKASVLVAFRGGTKMLLTVVVF